MGQPGVVARLAMPGREHLAPGDFVKNPFRRCVALAQHMARGTHPVQMHVERERRGRGVIGEPGQLMQHSRQGQPGAAQLDRHRRAQESGVLQVLKILEKEPVLSIILGRARADPLQHLVGQERPRRFRPVRSQCATRPGCLGRPGDMRHDGFPRPWVKIRFGWLGRPVINYRI
jgi:hypothetical protein